MTEPRFDNLSDREILIMTCRETFSNSARLDRHSVRIDALENWKNWLAGAIAVVAAMVGIKVH